MGERMKRILVIAGIIGVVAVGAFFILQGSTGFTSAETLTEQEARESVLNRYTGEIVHIELREGRYEVKLELNTGLYEIHVDAHTGDVLSLERKEEYLPDADSEGIKSDKNETPSGLGHPETELDRSEIKQIVQEDVPGEIRSLERVVENGVAIYRATVVTEQQELRVTINPFSGNVISTSTIEPPPPRLISEKDAIRIAKEHTPGEVDDVEFAQIDGTGFYLVEIEQDDDKEAYVQIHAITGEIMSVSWDDDAWDDL